MLIRGQLPLAGAILRVLTFARAWEGELEGVAIRIRVAAEGDGDGLLDIYAPVVRNTPTSFETVVLRRLRPVLRISGVASMRAWTEGSGWSAKSGIYRRLCLRHPFQSARGVYLNPREARIWFVEVSVYVNPSHCRRGIGRALYTSQFRCLALQGYCTAVARKTLPNPAGVALLIQPCERSVALLIQPCERSSP